MGREPSWGKDIIKISKENAQSSPVEDEQKVTSLMPSEHLINLAQGHDRERNL
jgi:hypothetical protein